MSKHKHPSSSSRWPIVLVLLILVGVAVGGWWYFRDTKEIDSESYFEVKKGPLTISLAVEGTINSLDQVIVKNQLEGKNTILWLIPEGTQVAEGDVLVKLDPSKLEQDLENQTITVTNSNAAFVRARENLAVVQSQAQSDLKQAELNLALAKLDLNKYTEGEYPQRIQQAEADISIAKEELQRAEDKLEWSRKLATGGYITRTELQADELSAKRARLNLELAEQAMTVLEKYTHKRELAKLQSDIEQAKMALDRVKRRTRSDLIQAEADLQAKQSELQRQEERLAKFKDQLTKCVVKAPVAGMAIYATTGKRHADPLEEGMSVREGEELIALPRSTSMKVDAKIAEADIRKVSEGMPCQIQPDSQRGKTYSGTLAKIGLLPDPPSWSNGWRTVYSIEIHIEGDTGSLRPGTTCRTKIIADAFDDAIFVPVQTVIRQKGKPFVQVHNPDKPDKIEQRPVKVGNDNGRMIHVLDGLAEGEKVLLSPRLEKSEKPQKNDKKNQKNILTVAD